MSTYNLKERCRTAERTSRATVRVGSYTTEAERVNNQINRNTQKVDFEPINRKLFDQPIFREVTKENWVHDKTFKCKHISTLNRINMAT